ncbi:MAG: radical SAM protein [Deltaproteobacteria bacterium]|nr:radical SAM protein [Deltaproteobacteria bacterium]
MLSRRLTTAKKLSGAFQYLRVKTGGWPKLINLEVTKLCNAKCDFCPCWTIKDYPQLDDYSEIMARFRPTVLSLNGGEPLLRKDILKIVDQVRPHCTYLMMITHGQLLTEEKFKALTDHGVNQLSVSLNYIGEEHDQERQLKGLYRHFSELLPKLTRQGYDNIAFNTVIMDRNLEHILPIAKKSHEWGVKVSFSSYSALKNDKGEYAVRQDQLNRLEEVIGQLLLLKKTQGNILTSDYYLKKVPEYFRNGKMEDCRAGLNFIQMTPDGYIKRCSEMPVVCHWTEYDADRIENPNPCDVCWLSCRGETETPLTPSRIWEFLKH